MKPIGNAGMFMGTLLLGAIGGVIGSLLAPNRGARTRPRILPKGEKLANAMKASLDRMVDNAEKDAGEFKAKARKIIRISSSKVHKPRAAMHTVIK